MELNLFALRGFPLVEPGDDLVSLIFDAMASNRQEFQPGDVLVLAQKIVSKAENRYAYLNQIEPSAKAVELAENAEKDSREVELILRESSQVVRVRPGVLIVKHRLGYVHANAGIDKSNIKSESTNPRVLLLPENPDRSCHTLREKIRERAGVEVAVIINDSAGRAWRMGTVGMALGTAGFEPVVDQVGDPDLFNRPLQVTQVAVADELASAASFLMGQGAEALPVVVIRGATLKPSSLGSESLIRPEQEDMFL